MHDTARERTGHKRARHWTAHLSKGAGHWLTGVAIITSTHASTARWPDDECGRASVACAASIPGQSGLEIDTYSAIARRGTFASTSCAQIRVRFVLRLREKARINSRASPTTAESWRANHRRMHSPRRVFGIGNAHEWRPCNVIGDAYHGAADGGERWFITRAASGSWRRVCSIRSCGRPRLEDPGNFRASTSFVRRT